METEIKIDWDKIPEWGTKGTPLGGEVNYTCGCGCESFPCTKKYNGKRK